MNLLNKDYRLLIVDNESTVLADIRNLLFKEYALTFAKTAHEALSVADKLQPDLVLIAVGLKNLDGFEVCKTIKKLRHLSRVPVIFMTSISDPSVEKRGFECGGSDFIRKPLSPAVLKARIKIHLSLYHQQKTVEKKVQERTAELMASCKGAIYMLGEVGHFNDSDPGLHIWRMAAYSVAIARKAGWSGSRLELLAYSAPLHDLGKIGIQDTILKKPGKLTSEEWITMRNHTMIGYKLLSSNSSPLFQMAAEIAYTHHEKWDGTGYPRGLKGEEIPESARVVAIADVFDILTMQRSYKAPWPIKRAVQEIKKNKEIHFDPVLVDHFIEIYPEIIHIKEIWDSRE